MQKLLAVPRVPLTFFGLSSCLFAIGSLQGIMERVCALPSDVVRQVADLAIQLLDCSQNQARKNAALFFAAAFVFRAVLDAFDSQDGLQKLLGVLNDAASKLGITSPTKPSPRISSLVKFTASVLSAFLLPSSVSPIPPNFRFFLLGGIGNRQFSAVGAAAAASMEEPTRQSQAPDEAAEGGSSSGGGGATTEPPQVPQADEEELLVAKAQSLLDRITAAPDNPSPTALHALASLLESQESRYVL
ncbi:hypothetical protein CRG98_032186 [Punica granatum]|uniref:Uncharacterized protein n=1 Tax=Punica granatum TaxID=22663 RepID=A0A2I0ITL3_PUNGR|nr:hypothetical protein CRG98_032186 [Punica granatum]